MIEALIQPFAESDTMRRALVALIALSFSAPPIGAFLMLRRMSLMSEALSHAILPGAAVGYLLAGFSLFAMSIGSFAAGLAIVLAAGLVARFTKLHEDASLAAFYVVSLALGVTLVSIKGTDFDLLDLLFGNVLTISSATLILIASIATFSLVLLAILYRPLVVECFDPHYLRSVSRASLPTHFLFLVLVVLNLVGGFQALGTLLAVGIMLLPAVTARFWSEDLSGLIGAAIIAAVVSSILGLLLAYHAKLPVGPVIILVGGTFYLLSILAGPKGGLIWRLVPRKHLEA
jgi:zinc/manganese transport system permease protein